MAEQNGKSIWLKVLVGFLFTLILMSFTLGGNALSKAQTNEGEIKVLKANYNWIKESLKRIEGAVDTK